MTEGLTKMDPKSTKRTITRAERLQLIGLNTLAIQAEQEIKRIEQAAIAITGEVPSEHGSYRTSDLIWQSDNYLDSSLHGDPVSSVDKLLALLGITVVPFVENLPPGGV